MPIVNHLDLSIKAFNESNLPPTPRRVEDILVFLDKLLFMIPAHEKCGYVKAPNGAENSIRLRDGQLVRAGRVMYSDGFMYKFMGDVPNGGPQWVTEETGEQPHLYHPYVGPFNEDTDVVFPPIPPVNYELKIKELENMIVDLKKTVEAHRQRMEAINKRFSDESDVRKELPDYIGRNWAGTVISRPVIK